jgi:hypothetical protein
MLSPMTQFKYAPLALLLITSGLQAKTIEKIFDVSSGGTLKIEADVGSIDIDTHSKNTVLVEVDIEGKYEDNMEVNFENSSDLVAIEGSWNKSNSSHHGRMRVNYKVTLPESFNIDVNTRGGSIEIEDLKGKVDAHTSGGSISLEDVQGNIDINTSGGSINLENIIGPVDAHTSGGSIKLKMLENPTQDSKLKTSGGSITAYLSKDTAVNLVAKTSGGRVSSEFDIDGKVKKQSIDGLINGGGSKLVLKTSGGNVRIKRL